MPNLGSYEGRKMIASEKISLICCRFWNADHIALLRKKVRALSLLYCLSYNEFNLGNPLQQTKNCVLGDLKEAAF